MIWINKAWDIITCGWRDTILKNNQALQPISHFPYEVYRKPKTEIQYLQ